MLVPDSSVVIADHVFRGEQSTLDLYVTHTKDVIGSTVNGFNGRASQRVAVDGWCDGGLEG